MIYFTAHTFNCVCHSIRTMFRVLGVYNFASYQQYRNTSLKTQNGEKLRLDLTFINIFWQNIKKFCKQNSVLQIHSIPDRTWQELTVCIGDTTILDPSLFWSSFNFANFKCQLAEINKLYRPPLQNSNLTFKLAKIEAVLECVIVELAPASACTVKLKTG